MSRNKGVSLLAGSLWRNSLALVTQTLNLSSSSNTRSGPTNSLLDCISINSGTKSHSLLS